MILIRGYWSQHGVYICRYADDTVVSVCEAGSQMGGSSDINQISFLYSSPQNY